MSTVQVNYTSFPAEVLLSKEPVAVDFYADWCGPCKMLSPILDKFSTVYAGRVKVVKVDVDSNPELSDRFHIRGVPTMLFFKDGKLVDQAVGMLPPANLAQKFDALVA